MKIRYDNERARLTKTYEGRSLCTRSALDQRLVWELIPDKCGHNHYGFNDYSYSQEKPAGVFRIVVIGDSVAEARSIATSAGLTVVDLLGAFDGEQASVLTAFWDDEVFDPWHLNPRAHELTAEYLHEKIRSMNVLAE